MYQKRAFSHYLVIFAEKMYRLEDINENMTSYGNHYETYTVRYGQLQIAIYVISSVNCWLSLRLGHTLFTFLHFCTCMWVVFKGLH